jgi:hypothetical protein
MNTINGNFIEKSIPNTKNATIAVNIGGVDSTMTVEKFAASLPAPTSTVNYKSYVALITQTGTAVPVATVLENTLDGVPVFSRVDTGGGTWAYNLTLTNAFPANKTFVQSATYGYSYVGNFADIRSFTFSRISASVYQIVDITGADGQLLNIPIQIRVYN